MNILKLAQTFKNDESGAVTVDWVVLTAGIVGLGLAVLSAVGSGVAGFAGGISESISTQGSPDVTAPAGDGSAG